MERENTCECSDCNTDSIVCDNTEHIRDVDGFCIVCGTAGAETLDPEYVTPYLVSNPRETNDTFAGENSTGWSEEDEVNFQAEAQRIEEANLADLRAAGVNPAEVLPHDEECDCPDCNPEAELMEQREAEENRNEGQDALDLMTEALGFEPKYWTAHKDDTTYTIPPPAFSKLGDSMERTYRFEVTVNLVDKTATCHREWDNAVAGRKKRQHDATYTDIQKGAKAIARTIKSLLRDGWERM